MDRGVMTTKGSVGKQSSRRRPSRARARASASDPRPKRSVGALVAQIGAAASAVGAVLGLVFLLAPSLKPDPPPTLKRASIGVLDVEQRVTYQQYLERTGLAGGDYDDSFLARPGVFVEFDLSIEGYQGVDLPLRWSLHDATGGGQVSESKSTTLRADAPSDRATWHVWAPLPTRRGSFFLRIQLFDADGVVPLDRAQTEAFPGAT
jgi:hypothetical protein